MSAESTATTLSSILESGCPTPQPPEVQKHTATESTSEAIPIIAGFPVDECFEQELDRRLSLDVDANGNTNLGSYANFEEGGMYTFEEFIKAPGSVSSRSRVLADNGEVIAVTNTGNNREADWKRVVEEYSASLDDWQTKEGQDDGFFNIALDSAQLNRCHKVPEDPLIEGKTTNKHRFSLTRPATVKRSAFYVVENSKSGGAHQQSNLSSSSSVCLRQTFCPTISARSNSSVNSSSYGGTGGRTAQAAASSVASTYAYEQSNSSSLYGNQLPPDEPRMVQAETLLTRQQEHFNHCYGNMKSSNNRRSTAVSSSFGEDGVVLGIHPQLSGNSRQQDSNCTPDDGDMAVYTAGDAGDPANNYSNNRSTYTAGLFVAKLLCCFSGGEAQKRREDHYRVSNANAAVAAGGGVVNYSQPEKYSWDVERPDPKNFTFADAADEVLIKNPGQVNGQQFAIENCIDSILIVLDHSSTVIIDDCKNCIIILGPCKGSVFIRDCSNCVIYAICQQFRSRDSHNIEARLFCTTAPTIEESNHLEFSPLWMSYEGIERHMSSAGLSPFTNQWSKVHNFTPESAKFTLAKMHSSATVPSHTAVGFQINDKFQLLVVQNPHGLTLLPDESFFFNVSLEKQLSAYEERALLLVKSFDKQSIMKTPEQLYYEARQLIRDVFRHANQPLNSPSRTATLRLLDIKDIDLRPGELETVLQLKFNSKSCGGKLVVIELSGADARHLCVQAIAAAAKIGHYQMVEVIPEESTEFYRTQLYRLSEIQSSV